MSALIKKAVIFLKEQCRLMEPRTWTLFGLRSVQLRIQKTKETLIYKCSLFIDKQKLFSIDVERQ